MLPAWSLNPGDSPRRKDFWGGNGTWHDVKGGCKKIAWCLGAKGQIHLPSSDVWASMAVSGILRPATPPYCPFTLSLADDLGFLDICVPLSRLRLAIGESRAWLRVMVGSL